MQLSVQLHAARRASDLIVDTTFLAAWSDLAASDRKQTTLQEPPFVTTWYRQYRARYSPLLCLGRGASGELLGVLPLAIPAAGGLVHAGDQLAEYHGWICHPAVEGRFPVACVDLLRRELQLSSWAWRWLPPGAPVHWLSDPGLGPRTHVTIEEQDSPLWDLNEPQQLRKLERNKSLRIKLNRYRRRGGLQLERIVDHTRFEAVLATIMQ